MTHLYDAAIDPIIFSKQRIQEWINIFKLFKNEVK